MPDLNYGDGDRKMGEMLDISGLLAGNGWGYSPLPETIV